ncbi:MAG: hypothetical protein AB7K67_09805 [Hyphomicrobiaceae bacterium]
MFNLRRRLDGEDFARAAAWRNGAFAAFTLAFPFLLMAYISQLRCGGGGCGALAFVLSIYIKPLAFVVFILSFGFVAMRRLRDAGLPMLLVVPLGLLMLADLQWATAMGAPWTVAFVTGFMGGVPLALMAALALIVTLSVMASMPAPEVVPGEIDMPRPRPRRVLGTGAWVFLSLLIANIVVALVAALAMRRGGLWFVMALHRGVLAPLILPLKLTLAAAPAVLALFWVREWRRRGAFGGGSPLIYLAGLCLVVVVAGAAVMTVVELRNQLGMFLAIALSRPLVARVGLSELLALLVLPWIVSALPREPLRPAAPRAPATPAGNGATPARAVAAGPVVFGKRGAR